MDTNQLNFWLSANAENFVPEALPFIKNKLEQMDNGQMMFLQSASSKKPSTIFLVAIIFGLERFLLGDIGLGILKIITGYGCGIWWLIDIFTAKKRAQKYNFEQFQKATAFMAVQQSPIPVATDYLAQEQPANNSAYQQTTPQEFVFPPVRSNNESTKIIVIVIVLAALIGGGLLVYNSWYSVSKMLGIESARMDASDIINLYGGQTNNVDNSSSLDDIFSEAQKNREIENISTEKDIEQRQPRQTEQKTSNSNQTYYSDDNNSAYYLADYLLTENDLRGLSKPELRILRNEIYARHGRKFKSQDLHEYFSAKDWYNPQYNEVDRLLNKIEKQNVAFIQRHE